MRAARGPTSRLEGEAGAGAGRRRGHRAPTGWAQGPRRPPEGARPQAPALTKNPEGQQGGKEELHVWGPQETGERMLCHSPLHPFIQGSVTSQDLPLPVAQQGLPALPPPYPAPPPPTSSLRPKNPGGRGQGQGGEKERSLGRAWPRDRETLPLRSTLELRGSWDVPSLR